MTMMIQAIRLTRKKAALAVILAGAVLAALILLLGSAAVRVRQSSPVFPATESGWHICGNWAGRSTRSR